MSDIFGAAGQVASAAIAADATKSATRMQVDALNKQRDFVYSQLNPDLINSQATSADAERAKQRLALQGITDPELLKQRYASEAKIGQSLETLGNQSSAVSGAATSEALAGVPKMKEAQQKLIDAALKELDAGATLPPDVQNEIVQTGLERAGQTTGSASAHGFGGQILRKMLGQAGIELQNQRQAKATALTSAAQQLETQRQQILGTLFPNLNTVQLNTLKGQQSVLAQANQSVPEAGTRRNGHCQFVAGSGWFYQPACSKCRRCCRPWRDSTRSDLGKCYRVRYSLRRTSGRRGNYQPLEFHFGQRRR
jgi:hypothetical protein